MIKIPMKPLPSFVIEASLEGVGWSLRFDWNATARLWVMSIADATLIWRLQGVAMVPNTPLLRNWHHLRVPPGEFVADMRDEDAQLGYGCFVNDRATLYYLTEAESAALW